MTTNEKVARRKLSLLELAKELNNVSKACKLIGYSRQQFYEIRRNYQTYGAEGLLEKLPSCKEVHPNRVAPRLSRPSSITPSLSLPMARCGSRKNWLCKSTSVPVAYVACGNATICPPNTTACCISRKPIGSRLLSSMTSKFAC